MEDSRSVGVFERFKIVSLDFCRRKFSQSKWNPQCLIKIKYYKVKRQAINYSMKGLFFTSIYALIARLSFLRTSSHYNSTFVMPQATLIIIFSIVYHIFHLHRVPNLSMNLKKNMVQLIIFCIYCYKISNRYFMENK